MSGMGEGLFVIEFSYFLSHHSLSLVPLPYQPGITLVTDTLSLSI